MWTINELFYGPEPAQTYRYAYPRPVEVQVVKEQNIVKEKQQKGHMGDVHLIVDMCCEACVRKIRRVLTEISGVHSIDINNYTRRVTVMGDVKPETCLKAISKIRKRASLWAGPTEGGAKEGKKKSKKESEN